MTRRKLVRSVWSRKFSYFISLILKLITFPRSENYVLHAATPRLVLLSALLRTTCVSITTSEFAVLSKVRR